MKNIKQALLVLVYSIGITSANISLAQEKTATQLQSELVSPWLVTIEGEKKTRTLKINGVVQKSTDTYLLDAEYGFSDGKQTAVKAEMSQIAQERKLSITTQSDSKIIATQGPNDGFSGTFTPKNGPPKDVKITKLSATELQAVQESFKKSVPSIELPSAEVPPACASFLGGWAGDWQGIGPVWLWVVGVDATCVAKYAYGKNSNPKSFGTTEIKNGVLVIPRAKGKTTFELKGESIFGSYSGSDGSNSATLQKVNLSDDSFSKLQERQKNWEAVTAPTTDVPPACAAFFGTWKGSWSVGGFGEIMLRFIGVDANCIAKFAYGGSDDKSIFTAQIKDGEIAFVCNFSTGGTCVFTNKGNKILGRYSNSAGGRNTGVFEKVQ